MNTVGHSAPIDPTTVARTTAPAAECPSLRSEPGTAGPPAICDTGPVPPPSETVCRPVTATGDGGYRNVPAVLPLQPVVLSGSFPLRGTESDRTNRAASRKSRVYYMYRFLVSTYPSIFVPFSDDDGEGHGDGRDDDDDDCGSNRVNNGGGTDDDDNDVIILDVAGGKGDLSWFINNLHPATSTTTRRTRRGIHSIVLDPRPTNHDRLVRTVHFLETVAHPSLLQQRNVPESPTFQPIAALLPELVRARRRGGSGAEGGGWNSAGSLRVHVDAELVRHVRRCTAAATPAADVPPAAAAPSTARRPRSSPPSIEGVDPTDGPHVEPPSPPVAIGTRETPNGRSPP